MSDPWQLWMISRQEKRRSRIGELGAEIARLRAELDEQARVNGAGAEREVALRTALDEALTLLRNIPHAPLAHDEWRARRNALLGVQDA